MFVTRDVQQSHGHRTEQSLRVRTFIDFMVERMAGNRNFFLDSSELRASRARGYTALRVAET
ncbi:hypothetical protein [Paraburkholderia sacchari]|uniref:Uncharacterized protein n=1 Tax=Paraburkholderia sacchari TaxID=159450 RepID=A0A8T6ZEP6_9BURK|nr:hypothetical protein [Paraburkholderia sacchari]NLP63218.1 hypothetical protein [Paraburkholderia sacchari]